MDQGDLQLPAADDLRIDLLAGLFRRVSTSYKFLFFLALLDRLHSPGGNLRISQRELVVEMLLLAWYPRFFFRLNFGAADRIGAALEALPPGLREGWGSRPEQRSTLRTRLMEQVPDKVVEGLAQYVRARLIRPFLDDRIARGDDAPVNAQIARIARESFDTARPIYRIEPADRSIVLHPAWWAYLRRHNGILRGWAMWHWALYMQARNSDVPGIPTKLEPPRERGALGEAQRFWATTASAISITCPYSGAALGAFELDHFLPWSFVAHDRRWNLVPAAPAANGDKSDRLPDPKYVPAVARLHATALWVARERLDTRQWRRVVEPYVVDLHAPHALLNGGSCSRDELVSSLTEAYQAVLPPLLALAANHGFASGWRFGTG